MPAVDSQKCIGLIDHGRDRITQHFPTPNAALVPQNNSIEPMKHNFDVIRQRGVLPGIADEIGMWRFLGSLSSKSLCQAYDLGCMMLAPSCCEPATSRALFEVILVYEFELLPEEFRASAE